LKALLIDFVLDNGISIGPAFQESYDKNTGRVVVRYVFPRSIGPRETSFLLKNLVSVCDVDGNRFTNPAEVKELIENGA
jgi:hypothetical protein